MIISRRLLHHQEHTSRRIFLSTVSPTIAGLWLKTRYLSFLSAGFLYSNPTVLTFCWWLRKCCNAHVLGCLSSHGSGSFCCTYCPTEFWLSLGLVQLRVAHVSPHTLNMFCSWILSGIWCEHVCTAASRWIRYLYSCGSGCNWHLCRLPCPCHLETLTAILHWRLHG